MSLVFVLFIIWRYMLYFVRYLFSNKSEQIQYHLQRPQGWLAATACAWRTQGYPSRCRKTGWAFKRPRQQQAVYNIVPLEVMTATRSTFTNTFPIKSIIRYLPNHPILFSPRLPHLCASLARPSIPPRGSGLKTGFAFPGRRIVQGSGSPQLAMNDHDAARCILGKEVRAQLFLWLSNDKPHYPQIIDSFEDKNRNTTDELIVACELQIRISF